MTPLPVWSSRSPRPSQDSDSDPTTVTRTASVALCSSRNRRSPPPSRVSCLSVWTATLITAVRQHCDLLVGRALDARPGHRPAERRQRSCGCRSRSRQVARSLRQRQPQRLPSAVRPRDDCFAIRLPRSLGLLPRPSRPCWSAAPRERSSRPGPASFLAASLRAAASGPPMRSGRTPTRRPPGWGFQGRPEPVCTRSAIRALRASGRPRPKHHRESKAGFANAVPKRLVTGSSCVLVGADRRENLAAT